jgi:hypothetical protein
MSLAFRAKDIEGLGRLPKEQVRLTLIAGCRAAKSKLRTQNVNHIINTIFKRFVVIIHLKLNLNCNFFEDTRGLRYSLTL